MTAARSRIDLTHDLFYPILLFGSLGGMTWAVRGSSGFGAAAGCVFAGVALGAAWWYIAREPGGKQTRRYSSGWIILAMVVAFGISGNRGWMQWPAFWDNRLYIDYSADSYTYIDRSYGFLWLFIAGVPWAGLGACMIAWCAEGRRTPPWQWLVRLGCGIGMLYLLSVVLYDAYPKFFLPLYDSLKDEYAASPRGASLWKMTRDNREAMQQLGLYLGFLLFEVVRRDWKNVALITTVGAVNGAGWSLLQNWSWSKTFWPDSNFNFWRSWETSGGISIGIAFAVAYFLVNRRMSDQQIDEAHTLRLDAAKPDWTWLLAYAVYALAIGSVAYEVLPGWHPFLVQWFGTFIVIAFGVGYYLRARQQGPDTDPSWSLDSHRLERWGAYLGLILGLGISIERGFKGWANIYVATPEYGELYWENVGWAFIGTFMVLLAVGSGYWLLFRHRPADPEADAFPRAYGLMWLVIISQYTIALCITGPYSSWNEVVFNIYYVLQFLITASVVMHFHWVRSHRMA